MFQIAGREEGNELADDLVRLASIRMRTAHPGALNGSSNEIEPAGDGLA
ncbi:hypothetical protein [Microbacterium sp. C7(2022)]|nr:hypothetical protein [Microbacterium sp. C7(2022)]MDE0547618.1 hypothetical protein [Microbacterium sp. C7(2022)]